MQNTAKKKFIMLKKCVIMYVLNYTILQNYKIIAFINKIRYWEKEQLDLFLEKAQELIDSKYILADIKIVGLLKSIANSDTLMAIFKNCLTNFDREGAERKYLVKSQYLSADKGEFVLPSSSKELFIKAIWIGFT